MHAFDSTDFQKHQAEAKEKWGHTGAYREHAEKAKDYSQEKWSDLASGMDEIMASFALCKQSGHAPDSAQAQDLVKHLQEHITDNFYHCTNAILAGLGQMYVADDRFRENIDRHGDGTAAFLRDAIAVYCHH